MSEQARQLLANAVVHWRTTLIGIILGAVTVAKAWQESGHDPTMKIVGVGTALLGVLSKDN